MDMYATALLVKIIKLIKETYFYVIDAISLSLKERCMKIIARKPVLNR